jgi:phage tail sheath protein FI
MCGAQVSIKLPVQNKISRIKNMPLPVKDSILNNIQQAVNSFQKPFNEPRKWDSIKNRINDLLYNYWRRGVLLGATISNAYYINVGRNSMTQDDIDHGRLVVLVGLAFTKPAEFEQFSFKKIQ